MKTHDSIRQELSALSEKHLLRTLRELPQSGGHILWEGREYLNFSSNDYLDLANHHRVKAATIRAIQEGGVGATSSRLMSGNLPVHEACEKALATLCGHESALLFGSGYQANVGVLTSLGREGDAIYSDALNHASIIDGCRLSRAEVRVFRHRDTAHLEELLKVGGAYRRKIVVSDAVFSMDGVLADLSALRNLADQFGALLIVDEAHAIGVLGEGGGLCKASGVQADAVVGTLSKALGSQGGFVATSAAIREHIINHARSFIYSTGLAPVCAAAALEAIALIQENPAWGRGLVDNAQYMAALLREKGIKVPEKIDAPIIPVPVCDDGEVMRFAARLFDQGIIAVGIRPPTVPAGTARLRLSLTRAHVKEDIRTVVQHISQLV